MNGPIDERLSVDGNEDVTGGDRSTELSGTSVFVEDMAGLLLRSQNPVA